VGAAENKQLMRHIFSELSKGNSRPFVESMAEDFRWTVIGTTPWSKTYGGKQAVLKDLLGQLRSRFAEPVKLTAQRFIAEDDYVVVEARGHDNVTKAGVPYNNTYCFVFRLAGGEMREVTEYMDTALVLTALAAEDA
jgi:ketosteroid isomerase-like protein